MKQQTAIQTPKQTLTLQTRGLLPRTAVCATSDHDLFSNSSAGSRFGHDFSQVVARPLAPIVSQDYSKESSSPRIQAKLKIGQPGDRYEREADQVAEQVMRMPDPRLSSSVGDSLLANGGNPSSGTIQRVCAPCSAEYKAAEDENRSVESANLCPKCRTQGGSGLIQTKAAGVTIPEVTPAISSGIQSLQGGGRALSESERGFFEPRFGADFSGVRVHDDVRAVGVARSVGARAFTIGRDVVFGAGEYSPESPSGRKLFAHELTHVVQQNSCADQGCLTPSITPSISGVIQRVDADISEAVQQLALPNMMRLFAMDQDQLLLTTVEGVEVTFTRQWVYSAAGSGHLRRAIRPLMVQAIQRGEGETLADEIRHLNDQDGVNEERVAQLGMYFETAAELAMDISGGPVTRSIEEEAEQEFRIPARGWRDFRPADGHERRIQVARRSLANRIAAIRDNPEVLAHVMNTLDMFIDDANPDSHLNPDQIDLALVIAIANRESGRFDFLDTGDNIMTSAGPDAVHGGQGGLDNAGSAVDQFPTEIRDEIIPFRGDPALERAITRRRRGRVNPARMPARNMLAGYIVEIQRYQERFQRVLRRRFRLLLTEEQIDLLLSSMNTDARRAWIQAAFGSRLSTMLNNQLRIIRRHMRNSEREDSFQEILENDQLNLNAIVAGDAVMRSRSRIQHGEHSGEYSDLSGHRTRVSAAEASMVEEALPQSLLNYRRIRLENR